jgi:hypothetical protein
VKLDQLLATSPRIGALYIRYFALRIAGIPTVEFDAECAILTARILPLLKNLAHLTLAPFERAKEVPWITHIQHFPWETQPVLLKAAFQAAVARPSLMSLSLGSSSLGSQYSFADVASLEYSLLRHAKDVKRLSLFRLELLDTSSGRDSRHIQADDGPTVLLEHLYLTRTTKYVVDAMLSGLSAVDIKHLRSLIINQRSMSLPLLKANAPTLQKIRYIVPDCALKFNLPHLVLE